MMHSRDELRSRSAESKPKWQTLESGQRACWPIDPDGGGTWVGVREDGLLLGLLNLNLSDDELDPEMPTPTRTRGLVIPALMNTESLDDAIETLDEMDLIGMSPFRLVMCAPDESGSLRYAVARFDGMQLTMPTMLGAGKTPDCWASSGLGDDLVQCRIPIFEQMVVQDPSVDSQSAYHQFQWDDQPEYSVMMSRENARTSSVTTIEVVHGREPTVLYDPIEVGDAICDPVGAGMLR